MFRYLPQAAAALFPAHTLISHSVTLSFSVTVYNFSPTLVHDSENIFCWALAVVLTFHTTFTVCHTSLLSSVLLFLKCSSFFLLLLLLDLGLTDCHRFWAICSYASVESNSDNIKHVCDAQRDRIKMNDSICKSVTFSPNSCDLSTDHPKHFSLCFMWEERSPVSWFLIEIRTEVKMALISLSFLCLLFLLHLFSALSNWLSLLIFLLSVLPKHICIFLN